MASLALRHRPRLPHGFYRLCEVWRRAAPDQRRIAGWLVASVIAHALLLAEVSYGPAAGEPRSGPVTFQARLDTLPADRAVPSEPSPALPEHASPRPDPAAPEALLVLTVPGHGPLTPVENPPAPQRPSSEPAAVPPAPVIESAPRPGAEVAGVRDPLWLLARELDVLPRPLAPIEPLYPPAARARGISGHAQLEVSIDDTGRVVAAHAVSGQPPGVFDQAAEAAFRAARFAPGMRDGRPVHARLTIRVVFDIDEAATQPR